MAKKAAAKKTASKPPRPRRRQLQGREVRLPLRQARPTATAAMKPLLGGKGANLAEMSRIGLPVPPGFTITTEVCTYYYDQQADAIRRRSRRRCRAGVAAHREADRQEVRRPEEPAARLGALRRARLDARHDGHDPQPRPQRPDRRGAREQDRQPALRLGLLSPLRPDVRRRRARRAEARRTKITSRSRP